MKYLNIEQAEVQNGLGLGVTLYVSGCDHHCKYCFNKESWNKENGIEFTSETLYYLIEVLKGKSRLTVSGGDPLAKYNIGYVLTIIDKVKEVYPSIKIWVYTGYTMSEISVKTLSRLNNIDYLVDGKYDAESASLLPFRGSDNQVIWQNKNGIFNRVDKW